MSPKVHLYLSLIPETLVFSMLSPREFGRYLALGAEKRTHGQALFMEVEPAPLEGTFDLDKLENRCTPHPDGRPHRSSYISIYRTLEHIPIGALKSLYLVTRDGTVFELKKSQSLPAPDAREFYLYQEFCPVTPLVVSRLAPARFGSYITQPDQPVSVPRIIFADLELGPLAQDPDGSAKALPYRNLAQIRYCLHDLRNRPEKLSKIVDRKIQRDLPFWMIKGGFHVSDPSESAFYRMPSEDELRETDFNWWSSSRAVEIL